MPIDPEHRDAYVRAGELAVLCEGDMLGYDAIALGKWCDANVDIWACGTKTAIYGIADAIGRARAVLVVMDLGCRPAWGDRSEHLVCADVEAVSNRIATK